MSKEDFEVIKQYFGGEPKVFNIIINSAHVMEKKEKIFHTDAVLIF